MRLLPEPPPSLTLIPVQSAQTEIDVPGVAPKESPAHTPTTSSAQPRWRSLIFIGVAAALAGGSASVLLGWWARDPMPIAAAHAPERGAKVLAAQAPAVPTPEARSNASNAASAGATATSRAESPVSMPLPATAPKALPLRSHAPAFADQGPASDVLQMAYTALTAGQRDRAALLYQQWLGTHSEERDALLGLAYIAQRAGHDDEALAYYRRVLRQDPEHAQAHANVLTLNSKIDPNQAAISARDRVEQNPGSDATLAALGAILVKQGRLAEAALAFTHAQALAPGNATYAYNLAVARDRLHQYRLARGAYERAIALSSTAADTRELGFSRDAVQQRLQQLPASADYPSRALTELAER